MKHIIIANGPFIPAKLIDEMIFGKTIIALDGAIHQLEKINIIPQILLGDFDSIDQQDYKKWGIRAGFDEISENEKSYLGNFNIQIVPAKNQLFSDLEKAIHYCDQLNAKTIDVICATDGRMDHTLNNLRALRREHKPNRSLQIYTATEKIFYVKDHSIEIMGDIGDYCGIAAFPEAHFSSQGLLFDGKNSILQFGFNDSFSNQLTQQNARIEIKGEALIIAPGPFSMQKEFRNPVN